MGDVTDPRDDFILKALIERTARRSVYRLNQQRQMGDKMMC